MKFFSLFSGNICIAAVCTLLLFSCNSIDNKNASSNAATDSASVKLAFITNTIHFPVQMVEASDNTHRLFVADLSGEIMIIKNGSVLPKPFLDVRSKIETKVADPEVKAMFGFAFHPQFSSNKKLYVAYNAPPKNDSDECRLTISEFVVSASNPDSVSISSERKIIEFEGHGVDHDACEIKFGPDGYLYISMGDNHTPLAERKGQDLSSLLGKVLRIDVNQQPYGIPPDNPFVHVPNTRPEIWAYGLRRFWRFSFDPHTHMLIGGEVGDKLREETDIITKGGNYGWPIEEGDTMVVANSTADTAHFIAPIDTYPRADGICVIGGNFYYGDEIPALQNKYVFADYNGTLYSLTKNEDGKWSRSKINISNKPGDYLIIISLDQDENNGIYLLGLLNKKEGPQGVIYRLQKS